MPIVTKTKKKSQVKGHSNGMRPKHRAANIVAHRDDWADSIERSTLPDQPNPVLTPAHQKQVDHLPIPPVSQKITPIMRHAESHPYNPPARPVNKKLAHLRRQYASAGRLPDDGTREVPLFEMKPHKRPYKPLSEPRPGNLEPTNPPTFGKKVK